MLTYEAIEVSDREINLECQEINSLKNKSIICSLNKNKGRIECNLNENINNNCTLKNYLEFNNVELFSIILNEQNILPITCSRDIYKSIGSSRLSKGLIVLIILASIIIAIIVLSFIFIFRKYKNNNIINSNIKDSNISNIETSNDTVVKDILY